MQFTDAVTVAGKPRRTADGYLVAEARAVRTGIQLYAGSEVGKPEMPVVRVYRGADQVFANDSLQSFSHAPITIDHPDVAVDASNWSTLAVGEVSTAAKKDGEWVMLPLILKDASAIAAVESGKRELSAGYECSLDWTPGKTADGHPFDAQQLGIKINHLALVDKARAGSKARIGDDVGKWGASPVTLQTADERIPEMDLRKVLVDGLQVETTDAGATAISKLLGDLASSAAKLNQMTADHVAAIKAKDADLTKKDEEIGTLKADKKKLEDAQLRPADIDKLVADRAMLVTTVRAIDASIDVAGKSEAELRRAVVKSKLGDAFAQDTIPDAEIAGMFKAIAKDAKPADPFRTVVANGLHQTNDADKAATDAYAQMVKDMQSGTVSAKAN